jgi:tRNA (guanine37-N1)-methyltransferase
MHFDIFTLFPQMFEEVFSVSIVKRAVESGLVSIAVHNIRDYATDKHHITDDYPYGGGAGMVMKPEPIFAAVEAVLGRPETADNRQQATFGKVPIILLSPQGRLFNQEVAEELAQHQRLALICGHYEGVDERVRQYLATDELSIGDYVLTGGEIAAMVVVDAVTRLIPGVLDGSSMVEESHAAGLLEYPQYTRPPEFRGHAVPEILLSGHHGAIARWRRQEALRRTLLRRPDLLSSAKLTVEDREFLAQLQREAPTSEKEPLS